METPWKRVQQSKAGRIRERTFAGATGAKQQPNSGSLWFARGDSILNREYLVDNKITDKGSFTIVKQEFLALAQDAIRTPPGLLPALQPTIQGLELWVVRHEDHIAVSNYITALESEIAELKAKLGE